jgi:hypothetical protein
MEERTNPLQVAWYVHEQRQRDGAYASGGTNHRNPTDHRRNDPHYPHNPLDSAWALDYGAVAVDAARAAEAYMEHWDSEREQLRELEPVKPRDSEREQLRKLEPVKHRDSEREQLRELEPVKHRDSGPVLHRD